MFDAQLAASHFDGDEINQTVKLIARVNKPLPLNRALRKDSYGERVLWWAERIGLIVQGKNIPDDSPWRGSYKGARKSAYYLTPNPFNADLARNLPDEALWRIVKDQIIDPLLEKSDSNVIGGEISYSEGWQYIGIEAANQQDTPRHAANRMLVLERLDALGAIAFRGAADGKFWRVHVLDK